MIVVSAVVRGIECALDDGSKEGALEGNGRQARRPRTGDASGRHRGRRAAARTGESVNRRRGRVSGQATAG